MAAHAQAHKMEMGDVFTFRRSGLPSYCFNKFQDMRRKKELCDLTIKFEKHSITTHRLVLAAAIPYFSDIFRDQETEKERLQISMDEIDSLSLESLIDYAYSCKVDITAGNAKNLLTAACKLKMYEVRDACSNFLAERLTPENALPTRQLAETFCCSGLLDNVDSYICRNFEEIAKTQEFLNSSSACVEKLIGRSDLQCSSEESVFEFVIKWVKKFPEARKANLPQLLRKVRMAVLTPEYLTYGVSKEELIRTSLECRDIVEDARTYHLLPDHRLEISGFETLPRSPPRMNIKSNAILISGIYAVSRSTVLTVQHLDAKTAEWTTQQISTFQSDFHNGALALGNDILYYCDRNDLRSCALPDGACILIRDFSNSKYNSGAAVLNNKLYLCGGQEGESPARSVECYDLEKNESCCVRSMSEKRVFPGVVALNGHVYVLGGCILVTVHNSVEKYDPNIDRWICVAPMLTERCGMGCTTLEGKIYVCGGLQSFGVNGEKDCHLASAEVYDTLTDRWSYISTMRTSRFACSLVTYSGTFYVIGGYDENDEPLNRVDIYDPGAEEWRSGPPFADPVVFHQAVAIPSPHT